MARPVDGKREEFRKYLERTGVIDALTKVLVSLYEEESKPDDALSLECTNPNDENTLSTLAEEACARAEMLLKLAREADVLCETEVVGVSGRGSYILRNLCDSSAVKAEVDGLKAQLEESATKNKELKVELAKLKGEEPPADEPAPAEPAEAPAEPPADAEAPSEPPADAEAPSEPPADAPPEEAPAAEEPPAE